jgi:hypothetical protein
MGRRKNILRISLLIGITAAGGLSQPAFAEDTAKVGGHGSALASMKLLGEAFGKYHPGVKTEGPTVVTVFQVLVKNTGIQRIGGRIAGLAQEKTDGHKSHPSLYRGERIPRQYRDVV